LPATTCHLITQQADTIQLPDDREELLALARTLLAERDRKEQLVEELRVELLRMQQELERFKKWYYGPRADRLRSTGELTVASNLR
jgi:hypothetical protein